MSQKTIILNIQRYSPEKGTPPSKERFEVPYSDDMSVLDALHYVKDELDPSLAYRWSCRMAVCGSCGMVINGKPNLGCQTFLRDLLPGPVSIEPLQNFPIEKDLVIDQEGFLEKLEAMKPYIIDAMEAKPAAKPPETIQVGEYKQVPAQLEMFKQYTMCINCLLCYSACPQFGLNPQFVGPAALALGHRYNEDNRDFGHAEREANMQKKDGVWSCTFVGQCSEVCPKSVDPAAAIQQEKAAGALSWAASLFMPKREVNRES